MFVYMWSRRICSVVNTCSLDATIWNCAWVLCLNVLIWPIAKVRGFAVHNHKTCDIIFFQKLIALHHQQAQCWIMLQKISMKRFCHRRLVILFHLFDQMTPSKMADEISWKFTALRVLINPNVLSSEEIFFHGRQGPIYFTQSITWVLTCDARRQGISNHDIDLPW